MAIDFRIQEFFSPLRILRLRRLLEKAQWLPPDELRALQDELLARTIREAYAHVPYYRRLFDGLGLGPDDIQTAKDLKALPLMTKDDVRAAGADLVSRRARRQRPVRYVTSGTTGAPLEIYHGRSSNALEFAFYWRHWSWAGYRLRHPFAELQTTHFLSEESASRRAGRWQAALGRLLLNSNQVGPAQAPAMARLIRRHRCRYLKGLASTLYCLALSCREAGIEDLRFQAVFSTGEVMLSRYRSLIESVFHGPVLDAYGHMERTAAVTQCPRGGYHVNSDYGLLEMESPDSGGGGETRLIRAVGTSLHNPVMPLLRYDLGDTIEVFSEARACPCGRTLPLIKAIHGRSAEAVVTPDGRYLTSLYVVPDLAPGVRFIQFIQDSPSSLVVQFVPEPTCDGRVRRELERLTRLVIGPDMRISLRDVKEEDLIREASGKIRAVIPQADLSRDSRS